MRICVSLITFLATWTTAKESTVNWQTQVKELKGFCDPLLGTSKLANLTAGMITSRIEIFWSALLKRSSATKLLLQTKEARVWAAVLEWNERHISDAFLQTPEKDHAFLQIANT